MAACGVCVVIPAFRSARTLHRAVASALAEVAPDQVVVVFDGPDPVAREAMEDLVGVRIVELPESRGAPACRNVGWRLADGEFVIFLDADDYLEGSFLEAAERAGADAAADIVFGPFAFEFQGGVRRQADPTQFYGDFHPMTILKRWLMGEYTPPCAVVWRRAFVEHIGGWDESLAKNQDGDLMFRALFHDPGIAHSALGNGVYVQDDDPNRITRRHDLRMLSSQIAVLEKIRAHMDAVGIPTRQELGFAYYNLARLAFTHSIDEIGVRAEGTARELGVLGEPGAFAHAVAATFLGLRRKQRLARIVRENPMFPARLLERALHGVGAL